MADDLMSEAKAARDELYLRIIRHADVVGKSFEQAAAAFGLTEKQIAVLNREHPRETKVFLGEEFQRRINEGLWVEDKCARRAGLKERVFRRRCPSCGAWSTVTVIGNDGPSTVVCQCPF